MQDSIIATQSYWAGKLLGEIYDVLVVPVLEMINRVPR